MKRILPRFATLAISAALLSGFSSCSSDDDAPLPKPTASTTTVFGARTLQSYYVEKNFMIERFSFDYNASHQLTKLTDERTGYENNVQVQYGDGSARVTQSAIAGRYDDLTFGENKFVETMRTYDTSTGSYVTYTFKYDASGRLITIAGDNKYYVSLSWNNGDLTSVVDSRGKFVTIDYGTQTNFGVMLLDSFNDIDLGLSENLYFGGMFGTYTVHLPSSINVTSAEGNSSRVIEWATGLGGVPTRADVRMAKEQPIIESYIFSWN